MLNVSCHYCLILLDLSSLQRDMSQLKHDRNARKNHSFSLTVAHILKNTWWSFLSAFQWEKTPDLLCIRIPSCVSYIPYQQRWSKVLTSFLANGELLISAVKVSPSTPPPHIRAGLLPQCRKEYLINGFNLFKPLQLFLYSEVRLKILTRCTM